MLGLCLKCYLPTPWKPIFAAKLPMFFQALREGAGAAAASAAPAAPREPQEVRRQRQIRRPLRWGIPAMKNLDKKT